jgi:hypothetical protein
VLQSAALRAAAKGEETTGWIIVGRGVRFVPHAVRIEGYTLEDIDWPNIGRSTPCTFWAQVGVLGVLLGLICKSAVIALADISDSFSWFDKCFGARICAFFTLPRGAWA